MKTMALRVGLTLCIVGSSPRAGANAGGRSKKATAPSCTFERNTVRGGAAADAAAPSHCCIVLVERMGDKAFHEAGW